MKNNIVIVLMLIGLFAAAGRAWAGGETITLKDGTVYHGDILFSNDREYVISINGKPEHIPIADIQRIDFGNRVTQ